MLGGPSIPAVGFAAGVDRLVMLSSNLDETSGIISILPVEEKNFSVSIIPHTSEVTTLGSIKKDDIVNIEIDILARYIDNNIKKIK